jgi:CubicO group peptidase (beta-lactamase class C family)
VRYCKFVIIALILLIAPGAYRSSALTGTPFRSDQIDAMMDESIASGLIAGGVVLVGTSRGVLFEKPYGRVSADPLSSATKLDTIFDIASLTKVVATAPAVLKLAEEGRLSLVDPVRKWLPEFAGRDDLLVWHLLTHTSGLDDFSLSTVAPMQSALAVASAQKPKGVVGSRFRYADINFILLGEIVTRVSGLSLDRFATGFLYVPLSMTDTLFNPDHERILRCSATVAGEQNLLVGQPQDHLARQLGGIAGHAGLFSTAEDLARFSMMILNKGEFLGNRVLATRTVEQMSSPYFARGGDVKRGLGWDIASPYSAPRGAGFSEESFGHTGYSGSSLWIDPYSDVFVVLLTTRLDYRNKAQLSRLRGNLSTIAAAQLSPSRPLSELLHSVIIDH